MDSDQLEEICEATDGMREAVASPCVGVCKLNPHNGLCLGCLRSLDEISAWSRVSPFEQRRILTAVAERRKADAA